MKNKHFFHCLVILISTIYLGKAETCEKLYGVEDSFVCVCKDATCGTIGKVDPPSHGNFTIVTSSRNETRFDINEFPMDDNINLDNDDTTIFVNISREKQMINGFGGAFTDAAGINIATLDQSLQQTLIRHYFAPEGIEFNMGRVPIAGTDFSTHPYSYDDIEGDVELNFFNLTEEDHLYKIPYIKMAQSVSNSDIKLFASPWAPPYWMKTNGMVNGSGSLLPEMQQPWADYFIRFFEAYEQESVMFWGLTSQNEPSQSLLTDYKWNACGYNATYLRDFIKDYLGPTLNASAYRDVILMTIDDSRETFPLYPNTILSDSVANSYVQGVGVHWYADNVFPASLLDSVHDKFPDKFLLYTEACHEPVALQHGDAVKLGSWTYGEEYLANVIEDLNHWVTGWVDWNMVLDMNGGPNWSSNFVDSAVIVSDDGLEFYKQPMFYALGHVSKFIVPDSVVLETTVTESDAKPLRDTIFAAAVRTPSDQIVIIVLSRNDEPKTLKIEDSEENVFSVSIPPRSFNTIIYNL